MAPEGRKVGSLKQRVRSHLARLEMKSCTPFWREAHFEVKKLKAHHIWSTFGSCDSCDVEKVHAIAHVEVKMYKAPQCRSTFGSCTVEKVHAVVARSTFRSQKCKKLRGTEHFWTFRCRFAWQEQGIVMIARLVKSKQKREG